MTMDKFEKFDKLKDALDVNYKFGELDELEDESDKLNNKLMSLVSSIIS